MRYDRRKLTAKFIDARKKAKEGDRDEYPDSLVPGLELRVTDTGHRSYILLARYPENPKNPTRRAIGSEGEVTLEDAREKAREWLRLIERGIDPRQEEARQKAENARLRTETLRALAPLYKSTHLDTLRTGERLHREIENEILPQIGDLPVRQITRARGMVLLDLIEADHGRTSRDRRLALLKHWWGWMEVRELVDGNVFHRIPLYGTTKRDRVLSDVELVEIWKATYTLTTTQGPAVRMLILTGLRRNECFRAPVAELDAPTRLLTIDGSRMKAGLSHEVPLSDACMAVLAELPRWNDQKTYLFPSLRSRNAPIGDHGQIKLDLDAAVLAARQAINTKAEAPPHWTFHDLRRTMRSGLSKLRIPSEIAERCIAHLPGGVEEIYDRHEFRAEKLEAFQAWARYVMALVNSMPKVASIEQARTEHAIAT